MVSYGNSMTNTSSRTSSPGEIAHRLAQLTETPNSEASMLAGRFDPKSAKITPVMAEHLLAIQFEDEAITRMNVLSGLAQQAALSKNEESELDSYIHISNALALLQSRARRLLGNRLSH